MFFKIYISLFLLCIFQPNLFGQNIDRVKGVVKDATTKEPLAFATIRYAKDKGVISNEHGNFSFEWNDSITFLKISYVGYETMDFPILKPDEPIEIFLEATSISFSEVVVKAKDLYASKLFFKSIKNNRKDANKKQTSKLFRRTYSYRNDKPAELMEAFYTAKNRDGGVDFFHLKNGRFGVPSQSYFINIQLTDLLEVHKLFTREFNYLPNSPLDYRSLKKLRRDYDIQIRKKYTVENDTIFEIHFEPLRDKDLLFRGQAWIRNSNFRIEKVLLKIEDTSRNPFITVVNPKQNKVGRLDLNFNIGFKYHNGKTVFDYIQMEEQKIIKTPSSSYWVKTHTKLLFYDYDNPFQLPFFSEFSDAYHDYEKILFFPYNKEFWKRNFLIAETAAEEKFRKTLDEKKIFENQYGEQAGLIKRRFEPWSEDWQITPHLISEKETRQGEEFDEVEYVNQGNIPQLNNLFAKTFISLDYECYSDTTIFKTEAILDYRFSYSMYRRNLEFKYLENFLHLTKIHANELQNELIKKYGKTKDCPNRNELEKMLDVYNSELKKEAKKYKSSCHFHRAEYSWKELTDDIQERLKQSFEKLDR